MPRPPWSPSRRAVGLAGPSAAEIRLPGGRGSEKLWRPHHDGATALNRPALATLRGLLESASLPAACTEAVALPGDEPGLPSSFRVGAAAQASIAAAALAAAEIHRRRGGPAQHVEVPLRHALAEFRSERHLRLDDAPPPDPWDALAGLYRCGEGGAVRLHTNFPHHRDGILALLGGLPPEREAVAAALRGWSAAAFEEAAAEAGLCVAMLRDFAGWEAHPQGRALAGQPPLVIERMGDAPPTPLPPFGARPLAGLRVLEMTRIVAGPVAGRCLAAHGAEVLHVSAAHLPSIPGLDMDTGRGKRTARLDLRQENGAARLRELLQGADIFLQSYRPGALAGRGFGEAAMAALRPGLICVSLSAYGHRGPWAGRRGFDSLVQTATGFNHAEAEAAGTPGQPRPLPCQALDHASGYLLALGAMAALLRRAEEGGSWRVRVSLAATGQWLRGLGRVADGFAAPDPGQAEVADLLEESESGFGRLRAIRHAARMSATPARWEAPAMPLGSHEAAWIGGGAASSARPPPG
ncbi:CoA transferase [Roseomonas sp. E05]|uniref:CoA transferase n=1 Tax=Roseomonas sp. E05 TaxID=3046310 RepID=UPI0024BA469A|nr:CoA transferase [Roseomonas sp. E05]MDJ0386698.1 CoA transferase [Roseomonas sp. E05]